MNLYDAVLEAVRKEREYGQRYDPVVILVDGEHECIPSAYLNDVSWCHYHDDYELIVEVPSVEDWCGDDPISDEDAAEFIVLCLAVEA